MLEQQEVKFENWSFMHYTNRARKDESKKKSVTTELEKEYERLEKGPHKRFLLFAHSLHYEAGGLADIEKDFDSLEDAQKYIENQSSFFISNDEAVIYDRIKGIGIEVTKEKE